MIMLSLITFVGSVFALNSLQVNQITVPNVAFSFLLKDQLYLAAFGVFQDDHVFTIPQSQVLLNNTRVTPKMIPGKITWPNGISDASKEIFGQEGIVTAGGFLTPFKDDGGIWFSPLVNGVQGDQVRLFSGKGFFNHRIAYYDVNGDGLLDIITCRAKQGQGDLVWMEPKDRKNPTGPWVQNIIGKGCDTHFQLVDVNGDGKLDILSAEFWGKKLTLIQSDEKGRFDNFSKLKITTIDSNLGSAFDVEMVDVNGDGKKDLLVTNHESQEKLASVIAYEIPDDVANGKWIRHDLATGFKVLNSGPGQAAPGGASAFKPVQGALPHIVVSGDGDQKVHLLTPTATTVKDWTFTRSVLHNCACTAGYVSIGDTNKDGKAEIFIPCYEKNYLAVYSF